MTFCKRCHEDSLYCNCDRLRWWPRLFLIPVLLGTLTLSGCTAIKHEITRISSSTFGAVCLAFTFILIYALICWLRRRALKSHFEN